MKIVFDKLKTSKETIQVSFDGGTTWNSYIVSEIINDGIPLDENQEYDKIQIKGSSTVLKNLDVVKSIEIPESNNTKDEMFIHHSTSFYYNLVSVKIPESFTSIGRSAFQNCKSLKTINFKGTEDQWNAISKSSSWYQGCPSDMQIICNYQGE